MGKFFKSTCGTIHFEEHGAGPVVVIIHGYLETSEVFSSFAQKLAGSFRVITVDLPGHGKSENTDSVLTMELMASVIAELVHYLNIKKIFLAGHSLGGYVTLAFAELFPDLLSGYCLLHSHPFADDKEKIEKRNIEIKLVGEGKKNLFIPFTISKLFATATLDEFSWAVERSRKIALAVPEETITAVLKGMMARPDRKSVLESGKVPCLWILGANDNLINCELIQSKVNIPANARIVVLHNSGHMGFIEEEDRSVSVITEFVIKPK